MKFPLPLLIVLTLLGCLPFPAHAGAKKVNLVFWGVESGEDTKDQDAEIAEFERLNPNIKVTLLSMGAGNMNPQKLMTAIVGGVPPDIVQQDRFTIGDWASRSAFMSLDSFLAQDAVSKDPLAIKRKDFLNAPWSEAVYKGKVYAIPNVTDSRLLFYNKTMFKNAGLDPNKPPQTWDEMMSDAVKMTKRDSRGNLTQIGFIPCYGQGWLYLWSWQEDGEFMSPQGRCAINNPRTVDALTHLVKWYDQLGGMDAISAFSGGFGSQTQDPFFVGKQAMRIDVNDNFSNLSRYGPNVDFGVTPAPVPTARFNHEGIYKHDPTFITWSGGASLAIPIGAKHPREAWKLIQWMTSLQAARVGSEAQYKFRRSMGRLYVPTLSANTKVNTFLYQTYAPKLPDKFKLAFAAAINILPNTRFRPVTFVGQRLWDEQTRAVDAALRHKMTPQQALNVACYQVQGELDRMNSREKLAPLPVNVLTVVILALCLVAAGYMCWSASKWMKAHRMSERAEAKAGFLFITPWIFGFLILTFGPILCSLILSFCDYDVLHPARWTGIGNYKSLVTDNREIVFKSLWNAFYLGIIGIPLGMITSLAMAILLNVKVAGQKWYRTAFYIPSIVPVVATTVLWAWILNPDMERGLLNACWTATLTQWFGWAAPGWATVPLWAKPALIIMGLWGAGGGMILWLAGLQSIPGTLYEAASIDGAGWWAQFRNITVPMLSPYIFFNLIMGIIGALQTFDTAYIMGGTAGGGTTGPDDSMLTPVIYLFNNAFQYFKMGYASAIAWLLFILILALTLWQLKLAPKWVHYEVDDK